MIYGVVISAEFSKKIYKMNSIINVLMYYVLCVNDSKYLCALQLTSLLILSRCRQSSNLGQALQDPTVYV